MKSNEIIEGMNNYIKRIRKCEELYLEVLKSIPKKYDNAIYKIEDKKLFNKIMLTLYQPLIMKKLLVI